MKLGDRISSAFWLFLSIILAIESYRLGLGRLRSPEAGFHPFLASVVLGTLSVVLLLSNILKKKSKTIEESKDISFDRHNFPKVLYVIVSLIIYTLLFKVLGFTLDTMILIGFLLRVVEPKKWYVVISMSVLVSLIGYILFGVLLKLQLPRGFLGF